MVQKRFQLKNTEMKMTTVNEVQLASLNNITVLLLLKLRKKESISKIQNVIKEQKSNFLKEELNAIRKHERINILRTILSQPITYYKGDNKIK